MKFNFSRHFGRNPFIGNLWMSLAKLEYLTLVAIVVCATGCQGVKRLTDGGEGTPPPAPKVIVGGLAPLATDAPTFNVPVPAGTTRVVYYGALPLDGKVRLNPVAGSTIDVFMLDRAIGQWFKLKVTYSDAFYYSYDGSVVQYIGLHLDGKAFCVYQYVVQP